MTLYQTHLNSLLIWFSENGEMCETRSKYFRYLLYVWVVQYINSNQFSYFNGPLFHRKIHNLNHLWFLSLKPMDYFIYRFTPRNKVFREEMCLNWVRLFSTLSLYFFFSKLASNKAKKELESKMPDVAFTKKKLMIFHILNSSSRCS